MARSVVTTRVVGAPARRVWELLTGPELLPSWRSGVARVDLITTQPFGPGTRYRISVATDDGGTRAGEEVEVTAVQDDAVLTELRQGRMPYEQLTIVVPRGDDDCEVVVVIGRAGDTLLDRAIGATAGIFEEQVRRTQSAFLDDLAAAATR